MTTRRDFLVQSAASTSALALIANNTAAADTTSTRASKPLRMLILGATGHIGQFYVQAALERGHKVSVFSYRPHTDKDRAELPRGIELLPGDRNGDLESIKNRDWDSVIDVATYVPNWVRTLGEALRGRVKHYIFISTIITYEFPAAGDEQSKVKPYTGKADPYSIRSLQEESFQYGPLKVLCEREAEKHFPGKALALRLGHIVGPNESAGALTYLAARMEQGGEVLAAGDPLQPAQFIDVRDLAEWSIRMAERGTTGVFNALGPALPMGWGEMLGALRGAFSVPTTLTWVPVSWLLERKVPIFNSLLFWPGESGGIPGVWKLSNEKARANGLTFRPLHTTITDTLAWYKSQPSARQKELLLRFDSKNRALSDSMAREKELLAAWHASKKA